MRKKIFICTYDMIYTRGAAQTRVQTADQMANVYSLKIGRNQMYYSLENFDFFAHSLQLQAGRPKILFFLPAFVMRILTPRSRKSGYGLLLGFRLSLDGGPFEKTFF